MGVGHKSWTRGHGALAVRPSVQFSCLGRAFWAIVVVVKALVKSRPEPGLWLDEIETPKIGINDVLIQVLRTGICGTDVHIYKWDEWAQATIPVPMAIGHEFVGRDRGGGLERRRFLPRRYRQRRRPRGLRALPQLPGRTAAPVRAHAWAWA